MHACMYVCLYVCMYVCMYILMYVCMDVGAGRSSEVERSLMVRWVVGSILHGMDPLSYFSFQPVIHDWCNKGRVVCVILSVGWCI